MNHLIVNSLKETNRLLIVDEDVSSGATGFMLNKILVEQNGYYHLDEEPATLSAKDHRPAYGTDGDYFSKPSIDDIVENDPQQNIKIVATVYMDGAAFDVGKLLTLVKNRIYK